ncbi:MAG: hypothetical protein E6Q97_34835 [Desulfurellales bacterium]|nr:MAG: hypothetical protein E6Q97_34835 [Desulfurellales bacterium]
MTTPNLSEMANYFATAGAALEENPRLKEQVLVAQHQRDEAQRHAQELEERIRHYKADIERALVQIGEVSAERDHFRSTLEQVSSQRDKLATFMSTLTDMVGDELRQVMPQSEPVPVQSEGGEGPLTSQSDGQSPSSVETGESFEGSRPDPFPHTSDPAPMSPSDPAPVTDTRSDPEPTPKYYLNSDVTTGAWDAWARRNGRESEIIR